MAEGSVPRVRPFSRRRNPGPGIGALTTQPRGSLVDRLLATPDLTAAVPLLGPEVLHRVIDRCGLEACGDLILLATPEQLNRLFDLDLWRPARAGLDQTMDADRFGLWIEVLVTSGVDAAATMLAGLDVQIAIGGLSCHLRVFDGAAVSSYCTTDGEWLTARAAPDGELAMDVGGYHIVASKERYWDSLAEVLVALEASRPDSFHRLMQGCRRLSDSTPERDGCDLLDGHAEQHLFDVMAARETRRGRQGYAGPAQARAFLQMARECQPETAGTPTANPIVQAYFREMAEEPAPAAPAAGLLHEPATPLAQSGHEESSMALVVDVLLQEGVLDGSPRALIESSGTPPDGRLREIQTCLQELLDRNPSAYLARTGELAYLVNVVLTGCSVQGRAFTEQEGTDAVLSTCNLGLEFWPTGLVAGSPPGRQEGPTQIAGASEILKRTDLIIVFQVGWSVLNREITLRTSRSLAKTLRLLRIPDRETAVAAHALQLELARAVDEGVRPCLEGRLDVLETLSPLAAVALRGLLDECPVFHPAISAFFARDVHRVDPHAFTFFSTGDQIAQVHEFLDGLSELLRYE